MANLTEVSQWENVIRQIENGEAATGGADGLANIQAKQLANRTKWLKENLAPMANAVFRGTMKHGANDLAGSAIVAKSLGTSGYVKYASGLIVQWGHLNQVTFNDEGKYDYTFPISFFNIPSAFVTYGDSIISMTNATVDILAKETGKITLVARKGSDVISNFHTNGFITMFAIGI